MCKSDYNILACLTYTTLAELGKSFHIDFTVIGQKHMAQAVPYPSQCRIWETAEQDADSPLLFILPSRDGLSKPSCGLVK